MITKLRTPCFIVQDGYPSGDGAHLETEALARRHAEDCGVGYRLAWTCCWTAQCECGEFIGFSDDYDMIHYSSKAEAEAAFEAADGRCGQCDDEDFARTAS